MQVLQLEDTDDESTDNDESTDTEGLSRSYLLIFNRDTKLYFTLTKMNYCWLIKEKTHAGIFDGTSKTTVVSDVTMH